MKSTKRLKYLIRKRADIRDGKEDFDLKEGMLSTSKDVMEDGWDGGKMTNTEFACPPHSTSYDNAIFVDSKTSVLSLTPTSVCSKCVLIRLSAPRSLVILGSKTDKLEDIMDMMRL